MSSCSCYQKIHEHCYCKTESSLASRAELQDRLSRHGLHTIGWNLVPRLSWSMYLQKGSNPCRREDGPQVKHHLHHCSYRGKNYTCSRGLRLAGWSRCCAQIGDSGAVDFWTVWDYHPCIGAWQMHCRSPTRQCCRESVAWMWWCSYIATLDLTGRVLTSPVGEARTRPSTCVVEAPVARL